MSTLDPHPSNATLTTVLDLVGHLPLKRVHYVQRGGVMDVDVTLASCADYATAKGLLSATAKGERDTVMGSGARAREAECASGIVSHYCFPHLDCWEGRR